MLDSNPGPQRTLNSRRSSYYGAVEEENSAAGSANSILPRASTNSGIMSKITIEPAIFLYLFSFMLYNPVFSFMMINKVCLQYCGYTAEQCQAYGTAKNITVDLHVQKVWAQFDFYSMLLGTFPGIIFALFMGPWSDMFGRKPLVAVPFVGIVLCNVFTLLLYFMPALPVWMVFLPNLFQGALGGTTALITGAFAFTADMSSASASVSPTAVNEPKSNYRTIRIGLVQICITLGLSLGGMLSGILMERSVPYYVCYILSVAASITGFLYTIFRIRETRRPDRLYTSSEALRRLFTIQHLVNSYKTISAKRPGRARLNLWLLFVAFFVYNVMFMGEMQINQKFFTAAPLSWSQSFYMMFQAVWGIVDLVAVGSFITVTKRWLKWRDTTLGICGCLSRLGFGFFIGVAQATWVVYIANTIGMVKYVSPIAMRTLLSAQVPIDEQGKMFSLVAAFDGVGPLIGSAIETAIFTATTDYWPGFFSVVGAYTTLIPLALLVLVDYYMRADAAAVTRQRLAE